MTTWNNTATDEVVEKTRNALQNNGINAFIVKTGQEAKAKILEMIPQGAEVMTMTSRTLDAIKIPEEINDSGKYKSIKNKLNALNRETDHAEMQKLGSAPEWALGSIHAVTEDGTVLVASNTGSQLPAYAYGSSHVVWVVGTQKIVKNLDDGMKRLYEYVLPLESERLKKIYGVPSNVSKLLIVHKEVKPNRVTVIFVKEQLGF